MENYKHEKLYCSEQNFMCTFIMWKFDIKRSKFKSSSVYFHSSSASLTLSLFRSLSLSLALTFFIPVPLSRALSHSFFFSTPLPYHPLPPFSILFISQSHYPLFIPVITSLFLYLFHSHLLFLATSFFCRRESSSESGKSVKSVFIRKTKIRCWQIYALSETFFRRFYCLSSVQSTYVKHLPEKSIFQWQFFYEINGVR